MGIGFVLVFWAILGAVLAVGGAIVLGIAVWLITRKKWVTIVAIAFPFACGAWVAGVTSRKPS